MKADPYNYNIFFDFIEFYLPTEFLNINDDDLIMQRLEELMEKNKQFFSVMNMEKIQILFASKRVKQMLGVDPSQLNPSHFLATVHPGDEDKLLWSMIQRLKIEYNLYKAKKGSALMSYSLRLRNPSGDFVNLLRQDYLFFTATPRLEVFAIQVVTNIDGFKLKDKGLHRYIGKDISLFKFPDKDLLMISSDFSKREMEIIRLIESGLSSRDIAEKLFLSFHTVSTHRSNILKKCGKASITELIYEMEQQGIL